MSKKIVYVDLDNVTCNYSKLYMEKIAQFPSQPYPQSQYGFFTELEPIKDAIESIKALDDHFEVYFLTAPSYINPMCYSEKNYWIRKHFGLEWTKKLIICHNKALLIGDYLIDDNSDTNNQKEFMGKLILFDVDDYDWKDTFDLIMYCHEKDEELELPL